MSNTISMYILKTVNNLVEVITYLLLGGRLIEKILVELAPAGEFHDHKNIICRIQNFVQFYDIWMRD